MNILLLIGGFITLLVSGEFLVRGGVSLAQRFHVSKLVIGMTLVSLGTSAPELVVSLQSAFSGHVDVSTGTVIGSNMSNIGFILGLTILILPMAVQKQIVRFDAPIMLLATLMLFLFIQNGYLDHWEGILFVLLLATYVIYSIRKSRKLGSKNDKSHEPPRYSLLVSVVIILVTMAGLRFGADWLVKGATGIATNLGISEYIISVTVVAVGTSLPELATSLMAAIKREGDISIGNIIGSNLFNIWGILGVTSSMVRLKVNPATLSSDIFWLMGISLLLFLFLLPAKRSRLTRPAGAVLLIGYILYIFFVLT